MLVKKYSGMKYTELFNAWGGTKVEEGNIKFQEDIKLLLETPIGSVLGSPSFGSNLYRYMFQPLSNDLGILIQNEIKERIEKYYSDIRVEKVSVTLSNKKVSVSIGLNNMNSNVLDYVDLDFSREV